MNGMGSRLSVIILQEEECADDDLFCGFATEEDGVEGRRDTILDGDELSKICFSYFALSLSIFS